jgi:hypothetical protein
LNGVPNGKYFNKVVIKIQLSSIQSLKYLITESQKIMKLQSCIRVKEIGKINSIFLVFSFSRMEVYKKK